VQIRTDLSKGSNRAAVRSASIWRNHLINGFELVKIWATNLRSRMQAKVAHYSVALNSPATRRWPCGKRDVATSTAATLPDGKPISFKPSSTPSVKCSSASASLPSALLLSFGIQGDGQRRMRIAAWETQVPR
jgi:hypothetical protein